MLKIHTSGGVRRGSTQKCFYLCFVKNFWGGPSDRTRGDFDIIRVMESNFFKNNRERLGEQLQGAPAIFTAYTEMQRCSDESWHFEQEANFWYLCGIEEADWQLMIDGDQSILIAPDISMVSQIFNEHISMEMAQAISGVDKIISHDEGVKYLADLAEKHSQIYTVLPKNQIDHEFCLNPAQAVLASKLRKLFKKVQDARPMLHKMRAIKQKSEIMMMRRAINLTRAAFETVKNELPNYAFEYQAQARFSFEFERAGAVHAYDPVIAGGANAITMHYVSNRAGLKQGELVLMDVGARYGGYSADITRTYAFGEPTKRQRAVHLAVKQAKDRIIDLIKPGASVREYLESSDEIMGEALKSLDLYHNEDDFRRYFPHAISHGLGIEAHDPLGQPEVFLSGMVLAVEPGIYIPEENIGVRLEDNVLVTESGYDNLASHLSSEL